MTSNYMQDMLALLQAMKGDTWSDAQIQRYSIAINRLPEKLGRAVITELCLETWRPAPMDILRAAAKKASPFPTVDQAYAEMMHKAETVGLYGLPEPNRPHCFSPGPPPFSHPLVAQTVQYCGGWRGICSGESQMQEGLSKQFRAAYERVSAQWIDSVIPALTLPARERPAALFPKWTPYIAPVSWTDNCERLALPSAAHRTPPITEVMRVMPPDILQKLRRVTRPFPAESAEKSEAKEESKT